MLNFGHKVEEKSGDIIPKDSLLWAVINIREFKKSRETGGEYMDIELTIAEGIPHSRRKIWIMIPNPFDNNNSEDWRTKGYGEIRRILEAVKGAVPDNANSYALAQLTDLHGLMVPIITTVEKGKDGYEDKNRCEFLSPHSSVKKIVECFRLLHSGVYEYAKDKKAPAAPGQGSMFTGTQNPPPLNMPPAHTPPAPIATPAPAPSFLAPIGAATTPATAPAPQGFQQPQGAPVNTGSAGPAANQAPVPTATAPTIAPGAGTFPSNPAPAAGAWTPPATGGTPAHFPGAPAPQA